MSEAAYVQPDHTVPGFLQGSLNTAGTAIVLTVRGDPRRHPLPRDPRNTTGETIDNVGHVSECETVQLTIPLEQWDAWVAEVLMVRNGG